jgi:hypothetical protein
MSFRSTLVGVSLRNGTNLLRPLLFNQRTLYTREICPGLKRLYSSETTNNNTSNNNAPNGTPSDGSIEETATKEAVRVGQNASGEIALNPKLSVNENSERLIDQINETTDVEVAATIPSEESPVDLHKYYHHFDTQKIYSSLKYSGFASGQADVLMLTMRDMLARALVECKETSVPLWASENEAYLFEAACSELKNDIQTARQTQSERYRTGLARLQREVEILQHEMDEIVNTLKVELDMEVNERKNATRAEENSIQLKTQEVNNRITININSDVKSEIEALRWQTTRRGLMAVIFAAALLLGAISFTKKEKPPPRREIVTGDEIYVPLLTSSEVEDPVGDRPIETLEARK